MKLEENPIDSPEEIAVREEIAAGNLDKALLLVGKIEETDLCDEMFYLIAIAFMQNPYRDETSARKAERRIQNPKIKAECAAAVTGIRDGFLLQRVMRLADRGETRSVGIIAAAIETPELSAQTEEFLPRKEKKLIKKETGKPSAEIIAMRDAARRKLYGKYYEDPKANTATMDKILLERIKMLDEGRKGIRDKVTLDTMKAIMAGITSPEKKAIAEAIRDGVHEETDDTFHC